jgi:hypothetical protein
MINMWDHDIQINLVINAIVNVITRTSKFICVCVNMLTSICRINNQIRCRTLSSAGTGSLSPTSRFPVVCGLARLSGGRTDGSRGTDRAIRQFDIRSSSTFGRTGLEILCNSDKKPVDDHGINLGKVRTIKFKFPF